MAQNGDSAVAPAGRDAEFTVDTDTRVQEILLAASNHDVSTLNSLLREYSFPDCDSSDVQDPDTKFSPLHAAIAACDVSDDDDNNDDNEANGLSPQDDLVEAARQTLRCLLENGAIWNQLDANNETPGCIALRLGLKELYNLMVDAGVRAELLLNRLEEYEKLEDDEDEQEKPTNGEAAEDEPSALETKISTTNTTSTDVKSADYLSSTLTSTARALLDSDSNGVMMAWETSIMHLSASNLLPVPGLKVLNIGFGMGIIDSYIQNLQLNKNIPSSHHIVEAHPDVLANMRKDGWYDKSNVTIHEGKWQDVLPDLVAENEVFDAIYFDTFAESYSQFREFFSENVIGLLSPESSGEGDLDGVEGATGTGGRWSFFNGMGADRQISYDVYQKVVEMELFEAGFDVKWKDIDIPVLDGEWEGVKRKYWDVKTYRLPVCRFMD